METGETALSVQYGTYPTILSLTQTSQARSMLFSTAQQNSREHHSTTNCLRDLTKNLVGILMCFRQEPVALLAEVELMFHQVCVSSNDCDALWFLWRPNNDLNCEPEEYQMMVHLFNATSSSSCVNFSQLPKISQGSSRHRQRTLPHRRLPQVSPIRNPGHWSGERAPHTCLEGRVPLDKMDLQFPEGHRFYSTIGKSGIREVPSPRLSGPSDSDGMWGLTPLASR